MSMLNPDGKKRIALLLDPGKSVSAKRNRLLGIAREKQADYIFVGGSLTSENPTGLINHVKSKTGLPILLFPGNLLQLAEGADGILLLSLISGRNPELLIGNHVVAAPYLQKSGMAILPVGYILVSCGSRTSVEYMSQSEAIPSGKTDIVVATAIAGEMLGLKYIYLEGGSGADHPIPPDVISAVRKSIDLPIITGGGLNDPDKIRGAWDAGADIVVLGNGCENDPSLLEEACRLKNSY